MYEHIGRNSTQAAHIVKALKRVTARLLYVQWSGSGHEIPAYGRDKAGTSIESRASSNSKKRDILKVSFPSIEGVGLISHKGVRSTYAFISASWGSSRLLDSKFKFPGSQVWF